MLILTTKPFGEIYYFGKYKHLLGVTLGNPLPSGLAFRSWNTWPSWGRAYPYFPPTFHLVAFPCCQWDLNLLWSHFHLFWPLFPLLRPTLFFWATMLLNSPWWNKGHHLPCIPPTSSTLGMCSKCLPFGKLYFGPMLSTHVKESTSLQTHPWGE